MIRSLLTRRRTSAAAVGSAASGGASGDAPGTDAPATRRRRLGGPLVGAAVLSLVSALATVGVAVAPQVAGAATMPSVTTQPGLFDSSNWLLSALGTGFKPGDTVEGFAFWNSNFQEFFASSATVTSSGSVAFIEVAPSNYGADCGQDVDVFLVDDSTDQWASTTQFLACPDWQVNLLGRNAFGFSNQSAEYYLDANDGYSYNSFPQLPSGDNVQLYAEDVPQGTGTTSYLVGTGTVSSTGEWYDNFWSYCYSTDANNQPDTTFKVVDTTRGWTFTGIEVPYYYWECNT